MILSDRSLVFVVVSCCDGCNRCIHAYASSLHPSADDDD